MRIILTQKEIQSIETEAILLPVDGVGCKLGGGSTKGIRAALPRDRRVEELEFIEYQLEQLRPIPPLSAKLIEGVALWKWIVVSAAYPHNIDGRIFSSAECAAMLRSALPNAFVLVVEERIESISMTVIGTAYRMSRDVAIRASDDGLAAASKFDFTVYWSLPFGNDLDLAQEACERLRLSLSIEQQ